MTQSEAFSTTHKRLPFPRNCWYAAAWGHELTSDGVLARTIAGAPLALYRTDDGAAVALADACWHRLAPLSMGRRIGNDQVECPYHGLRFDSAGRCTFMPAQETINPSALVRSFPIVERHRMVWVWVGDADRADPASVPDLTPMGEDGWAGKPAYMHVNCNFQLVVDNLMDLTHEEFVHATSIGQHGLSATGFDTTHDDTTVTVTRWMRGVEAPPAWKRHLNRKLPGYDGPVDRWQIIRFEAPSAIRLDVGVAVQDTGAPEGDRSQGVSSRVMNLISPETDGTCHYFWSRLRDFDLEDDELGEVHRAGVAAVFAEDEQMLEAQQRAIDGNPEHVFYSLNIDMGGMWTRRILERMLADEGILIQRAPSEAPA